MFSVEIWLKDQHGGTFAFPLHGEPLGNHCVSQSIEGQTGGLGCVATGLRLTLNSGLPLCPGFVYTDRHPRPPADPPPGNLPLLFSGQSTIRTSVRLVEESVLQQLQINV